MILFLSCARHVRGEFFLSSIPGGLNPPLKKSMSIPPDFIRFLKKKSTFSCVYQKKLYLCTRIVKTNIKQHNFLRV